MSAPRTIPDDMKMAFTLNGQIPIYNWYINEVVPEKSIEWTDTYLQSFYDRFTITNIQNGTSGKEPYMHGAKLHLFAFTKYIDYI